MSIKGISNLAGLMEDLPDARPQAVALSLIDPDPNQPRTTLDRARLDALAASVAAQGVIEPLIVSPHPETDGRYMLVAGERRWRAAGLAGLETVAVVVRELSAEQRLAVQLVENIDREALSVLEESAAVVRLIGFGRKPKDVAEMLGKTPAWVSLRRKIADHQGELEYFVAEGLTRDAETLAMLVDLRKVDGKAFEEARRLDRITRATVREVLDLAKRRKLAPEVPATTDLPGSVDPPAQPEPRGEAPVAPQEIPPAEPIFETPAASPGESDPPPTTAPRAARRGQGDPVEEEGDRYETVRRAVQAALGLPVSIHVPHSGKPGELRIAFADLMELEALRQTLT